MDVSPAERPTGRKGALQNKAPLARTPAMNPARAGVTDVIYGVRNEESDVPVMREIRILDKRIDERAKGRPMEKVLRGLVLVLILRSAQGVRLEEHRRRSPSPTPSTQAARGSAKWPDTEPH